MSDENSTEEWAFTFGFGQVDPLDGRKLASCFVIVPGDYNESREKMLARYGRNWAFQYSVESIREQQTKYEMTQVPWIPAEDAFVLRIMKLADELAGEMYLLRTSHTYITASLGWHDAEAPTTISPRAREAAAKINTILMDWHAEQSQEI